MMRRSAAWLVALLAVGCAGGTLGLRPPASPLDLQAPLIFSPDLSAPQDLRARSEELREVPLSWTPLLSGDVIGYLVERSLDEEHWERIHVQAGRFSSTHLDAKRDGKSASGKLADGATYLYRVRAIDSQGRVGLQPSAIAKATTASAPAPPDALRTFNHLPRQVALTWRASDDETVAGYVVSRSPSQRGPFEEIARLKGRFQTHLLDSGLGDLRVFYYQVAAFSVAGATGTPSEAAVAVTKAEPLAPAGLRVVERRLGANRVSWDPNVEADVTGYRVVRYREGSGKPEVVALVGGRKETEVEDSRVGAGEPVSYSVVALDADGLESLPAAPIHVVSEDYGLSAEVRDGAVHLRWNPRVSEGYAVSRILRQGLVGMQEIARVPSEGFVDASVRPGQRYRYAVALERPDGTQAPPSRSIEVRLPQSDPAR